jgi:hypothetical protein
MTEALATRPGTRSGVARSGNVTSASRPVYLREHRDLRASFSPAGSLRRAAGDRVSHGGHGATEDSLKTAYLCAGMLTWLNSAGSPEAGQPIRPVADPCAAVIR